MCPSPERQRRAGLSLPGSAWERTVLQALPAPGKTAQPAKKTTDTRQSLESRLVPGQSPGTSRTSRRLQQFVDRLGVVDHRHGTTSRIEDLELRVDAQYVVDGGVDVAGRHRAGVRALAG